MSLLGKINEWRWRRRVGKLNAEAGPSPIYKFTSLILVEAVRTGAREIFFGIPPGMSIEEVEPHVSSKARAEKLLGPMNEEDFRFLGISDEADRNGPEIPDQCFPGRRFENPSHPIMEVLTTSFLSNSLPVFHLVEGKHQFWCDIPVNLFPCFLAELQERLNTTRADERRLPFLDVMNTVTGDLTRLYINLDLTRGLAVRILDKRVLPPGSPIPPH